MSVPPLLVLGNANVDLVMGEVDGWPAVGTEIVVERSEMRAGGSAGNTALALTGLGVPHLFVASTGNDPNGGWLRERFDAACCDWIVDACDTTLTVGIVHKGGDRAFFTTPGHLQTARLSDLRERIPAAPAGPAFAIVSGGFLMPEIEAGTSDLLAELHDKGWRTAIDPGWPPSSWTAEKRSLMHTWLARADIALLNDEEAMGVTGLVAPHAAFDRLAGDLAPGCLLVVKQGVAGARAAAGGRRFAVAAPRVEVVDTVGAGDTFNAAFLAALARGTDVAQALRAGVECASRAISTFPRRYT
jgi:sugar/nucleoside kinase (ribokinase family)